MNRGIIIFCLFCMQMPACMASNVAQAGSPERPPNVILIICDDLNDYVEGYGGHPQARTPEITRLIQSGVLFTQAHSNIPICGPSRASLFTGIYPHHSGCFGFTRWDRFPVLKHSRTLMAHFRANGYQTLGTGKLMHHLVRSEWDEYGNPADYGPFAFDGQKRLAHPKVPKPFSEIGPVDGSFGPLEDLASYQLPGKKALRWQTGSRDNIRILGVGSETDRDSTSDELNGAWAVDKLRTFIRQASHKPFFMGVGFIRPHTPLIVPERFFDLFPLEDIELPKIRPDDVDDTHARSVRGIPNGKEPYSTRTADMGLRLYQHLVDSFSTREEALKQFIQAYLASVASVDEQIGKILDTVEHTSLRNNTIIVLTSDHGWGMGEKDYLYKNALWQESTQIPLIIRAPGVAAKGTRCDHPVSLIDLYPTLVDLCDLSQETRINAGGHPLDGHSLRPFLEQATRQDWEGPAAALTALYRWAEAHPPAEQSYALRGRKWRYIRYSNGREELYDTHDDPYEWHNLADRPEQHAELKGLRKRLMTRIKTP